MGDETQVRRRGPGGSRGDHPSGDHRRQLLRGLPVAERRVELAGIATALLEGGDGPPLVLLHGPGESAVNWRWVIPDLTADHRVVAPDLPAHGSSGGAGEELDAARILAWLDELIDRTCPRPPTLVGHVLGGAIAARYATEQGHHLRRLVLVDSLGLAPFRPTLPFLATMIGFQALPTETTYRWFMRQCAFDLEDLRDRMGERWDDFVAYNLDLASAPGAKAAGRMMRAIGLPPIPSEDLEAITAPTSLIWGREDRALSVEIAEEASERYGWPLHVIDDAADDPPRDRPETFLRALRSSFGAG